MMLSWNDIWKVSWSSIQQIGGKMGVWSNDLTLLPVVVLKFLDLSPQAVEVLKATPKCVKPSVRFILLVNRWTYLFLRMRIIVGPNFQEWQVVLLSLSKAQSSLLLSSETLRINGPTYPTQFLIDSTISSNSGPWFSQSNLPFHGRDERTQQT